MSAAPLLQVSTFVSYLSTIVYKYAYESKHSVNTLRENHVSIASCIDASLTAHSDLDYFHLIL